MADRSSRKLWRTVAVGCCLVCGLASLAGGTAASRAAHPAGDLARHSLRTLQLNLCDSGIADCYTGGRSVTTAAQLIRAEKPDIVTLNEICRDDLPVLERAMSGTKPARVVVSAFEAAFDHSTGSAYRCTNGQPYGIGLLALVPSTQRYRTYGALYPMQDAGDPEQRVWLCLHAVADFYACTTHLASMNATVALGQCGYLLHTALPALRTRDGRDPMVLGADLNLVSGGSPDARPCLTPGYRHAGDGARQYVVATPGLTVTSSKTISMRGTTDHPGLLVDLTVEPVSDVSGR